MAFYKKYSPEKGNKTGGFSQNRGGQFKRDDGEGRSAERNSSSRGDYRGGQSSFGKQGERSGQSSYGRQGERSGQSSYGKQGERSGQSSYGRQGERSGQSSFGRQGERSGQSSFGRQGERSGQSSFGRQGERSGYSSFGRQDERGGQSRPQGDNRFNRGNQERGESRPFSKPFDAKGQKPFRSNQGGPSRGKSFDQRGPYGRPAPINARHFVAPAPATRPLSVEPIAPAPVNELPENLLSGRNPIREAIKAGRDIEKLMVAEGDLSGSAREIVAMAKNAGVIVQVVERSRLDQITRNHQGMIAFASAFAYASVEDILNAAKEKGEAPFIVILDKITDPMNLGAIIRSAACVGAHGVVVQQHRAVGLTPSAVRASAGAVEHVKVARVTNINQLIRELKGQGVWVYAADAKGQDYRKVDFGGACALVIGSEGEGISQLTLDLCDQSVSIPMSGVIDSLNASVAAGILMYGIYSGRVQ